ncbi:MAG: hypothetical protein JJ992_09915, partial [Planctomycetes bacterium]|nr:hypothetical protein [Planctomycetota bacterium]
MHAGPSDEPCAADGNTEKERCDRFLQQAQWVLADQRGMTVKAQVMLATIARDLGLSEQQTSEAIRSLQQSSGAAAEPPPVAQAAPASPPREAATPPLLFRAYVGEALARSSREELSPGKQRRLIDEGTQKLGLAEVFARQIVHEVASAMGKRLPDSNHESSSEPGDRFGDIPAEKMAEFLERAAAILAEQRGINARSRVLLAAAASTCGLSPPQMERALQLLQGEANDTSIVDAWMVEREQAFRENLLSALEHLPHQVATSRTEQRWLEDGQLRFGLPSARSGELIRETTQDCGVRIVSEEKARTHIYDLAADLLDQGYQFERATRTRILVEGSQWGLTAEQIDEILRGVLHDKQQSETTRHGLMVLAIGGGAGLLGALLLFLGWVVFFRGENEPLIGPGPSDVSSFDPSSPELPSGQEWWTHDEDLLIAATKLRIVLPDLKNAMAALNVPDADRRSEGYRQLLRSAIDQADMRVHGTLLREFFAGCLAAEPSDRCATALVDALLESTPRIGDRLPDDGDESAYELPFWAVRTVLEAFSWKSLPEGRAELLAGSLGVALGIRVDPDLDFRELDRQCIGALSQHLYGVIISAANAQPAAAPSFYVAVTRQ